MSQPDPLRARITAADLPPAGPVFVVCLTTDTVAERQQLYYLLTAALEPGMLLELEVVRDESEQWEQAVLPL